MRIFKIIHGYPPTYYAGSEVYSQTLCRSLHELGHEVEVFCREENPFSEDYTLRKSDDHGIPVHLINVPLEKHRYRYHHQTLDDVCEKLILKFKPDVIHIGHLNHLSITLIHRIKQHNIPIVYTLHDFWLMCPRGQFVQRNPENPHDPWAVCSGQDNQKCAKRCYSGYHSGFESESQADVDYWTDWVERRMQSVRQAVDNIDCFVAPSQKLLNRFVNDFALPKDKIEYLDYGFDHQRLLNRNRISESSFVFGYIGTHIPSKGIQHMLEAFSLIKHENVLLRIWGRPHGQNTAALKRFIQTMPNNRQAKIEWMGEYINDNIVTDVFNQVDSIVVPSIWQENSPLVIHEALQANVGVITADFGGMSEYIQHKQNGWLFKHRESESLAATMRDVLEDTNSFDAIRLKGYLQSDTGNVPSAQEHASQLVEIYKTIKQGISL